ETVSVEKVNEIKAANIYPNPITSTATVYFDYDGGVYSFAIYNLAGARMKETRNISTAEFIFDRENLENGIYFYRLSNERGNKYSGKLLVQ
ncbi:MAG: hypothetical protein AMS23_07875, partial [Bacteroides sp. SM1_62]